MLLDAVLSYLHFLFVFGVVSTLVAEALVLRLTPSAPVVRLLARIDTFYGLSALGLLGAGFCRVFFGLKDASFYLSSHLFWAKIVTFLVTGIVSIGPTLAFIRWSRAARADGGFVAPADAHKRVRRMVLIEAHLIALLLAFAVLMARGIG